MFSWIPIHREAIHRILGYRQNEKELLTILREMKQQGLKVISLQDEGTDGQTIPLAEIDPFTFLASFNRGVTDKNRRENWNFLKVRWGLKASVPDDFTGIPVLPNMTSRLVSYAKEREKEHVAHLWQVAALAADGGIEKVDDESFNRCLKLVAVGIRRLTICLFWINPEKFLPADHKTTAYGKSKGITTEPEDYQSYRQWVKEMTEQLGNNYPQVSHEAHLLATQNQSQLDLTTARMQTLWARFHKRIKDFTDFQSPGADFVNEEAGYKRAILKKFQQELGTEKLSALLAKGQGIKAAKEIGRVLTSNLVSFHAWTATLGETDQATCDVVRECLKATSAPYQGPESTSDLFDACARHNLEPNWDALTVLLWALRPEDFFPVKISYYRKLGRELDQELPTGRPDADKLHTLIGFGRAFWKALEPQKPSDWVDVQSFIWCVCPGNYEGGAEAGVESEGGDVHETPPQPPTESAGRQYWTLSAGTGGEHWGEFYEKGIAAIGWDGTPDLSQFKSKDEIRQKLQELWPGDSSKKNDAHACWQFVHDIEKGDIIFAKQGFTRLLGYGVVEGDYDFDATRTYYRHVRKVKWLAKGEWEMPEGSKFAMKTLTDMTPYPHFVKLIASRVGLDLASEPKPVVVAPAASTGVAYWWLNANPKTWDFGALPIGGKETYTSHNEKGNKRRIYQHFLEVKPGDIVIGYIGQPQKEVAAVCRITQGLHQTENGAQIEFEKTEDLTSPIPYDTLQANADLAGSEPFLNNLQGSLFKLTEQEYEIIRSLIDLTNISVKTELEPYGDQKAREGLFLHPDQFKEVLDALKEKKNVVLQGAPGVGKTFIAERLAFAFIGFKDRQRVKMIQFHQSYSYEDFIQGFRPTAKGTFTMKYGIFHQFCRRAQRDEAQGKPYVFIIDEINRGDLSKIFGELMMLMEPDKRGKNYAIPLAYSENPDEEFYIPKNLHLLGLMNTADRSLAMVDYALRRRFRFIPLQPEFASGAFAGFLAQKGASPELVERIVSRMNDLNKAIADDKNLGSGFQIGHSYFCPQDDIVPDENWYRRVVRTEIVPLIQEYWFAEPKKVEKHQSDLLA